MNIQYEVIELYLFVNLNDIVLMIKLFFKVVDKTF